MAASLKRIGHGSRVCMHLSISLENGQEVLSTFDEEPLCFQMGDGSLREGMELALFGLKPGDDQTILLDPEHGYGASNPELIQNLPRSSFPHEVELEPGLIMTFDTPDHKDVPGLLLEVDDNTVRVDFNHPLSGRTIQFRVSVLGVE